MSKFINITADCESIIRSSIEQIGKVSDIETIALYSIPSGDKDSADIYIKLDNGEGMPPQLNDCIKDIKNKFPYIFDKLKKIFLLQKQTRYFIQRANRVRKKSPNQ